MLPLSHDEVVHGKGSLLAKMPGNQWDKAANLRAYLGFMWGHPGKKLIFMGGEIGQINEWDHDSSVNWDLIDLPSHRGIQRLVRDLNRVYRDQPALQFGDLQPEGFEWAVVDDAENSVVAMLRYDIERRFTMLVASNFTPVERQNYEIGVPFAGTWQVILNSDAGVYGGSDAHVVDLSAQEIPAHGKPFSLSAILPPLSTIMFLHRRNDG